MAYLILRDELSIELPEDILTMISELNEEWLSEMPSREEHEHDLSYNLRCVIIAKTRSICWVKNQSENDGYNTESNIRYLIDDLGWDFETFSEVSTNELWDYPHKDGRKVFAELFTVIPEIIDFILDEEIPIDMGKRLLAEYWTEASVNDCFDYDEEEEEEEEEDEEDEDEFEKDYTVKSLFYYKALVKYTHNMKTTVV